MGECNIFGLFNVHTPFPGQSVLVEGDCTGSSDDRGSLAAEGVVEEGLGSLAEGLGAPGGHDEGALDQVLAAQDGLLAGSDAVDGHSLDAVADCGQGGVADGVGVGGDGGDDITCARQLLAVLAQVLGSGDGLEAVPRSAASLAADQDDGGVGAADLAPVGDLAGVEGCDLLEGQVVDRVGVVDDDGDSIQSEDGLGQAAGLLIIRKGAGSKSDVAPALADCRDAAAAAGRVVGDCDIGVLSHVGLGQGSDDGLHGGGTVGGDVLGGLGGAVGEDEADGAQGDKSDHCKFLHFISPEIGSFPFRMAQGYSRTVK